MNGPRSRSFTCPRCRRTSYNPNDVRWGYCGACHDWTGDPAVWPVAQLQLDLARSVDPLGADRPAGAGPRYPAAEAPDNCDEG